ncbi:MAG: WxL protein peptidoglycan domain-containing protein [Actinomycetota bacterium]
MISNALRVGRSWLVLMITAVVLGLADPSDHARAADSPSSPASAARDILELAVPASRLEGPRSQPITWGVAPAGKGEQANRAAFAHRIDPGRSVSDVLRVTNYSASPLKLQIYPQDAVNTRQGGYDLLSVNDASRGVGAWVRLTQRTVTIPARSDVDVPFRIEVPPNASPGDHAGGVVAALVAPSRDKQGREVLVERRVGVRVYLRIPGVLKAELSARALSAEYDESLNPVGPGSVSLSYEVRNTGNVRLSAQPWAQVSDPTGRVVQVVNGPTLREVLPGQVVTMVLRVPRVWPLGRLQVQVGARPGPAPDAGAIGGATRVAPLTELTATSHLWAMPWATLAVLMLVIVATTMWWRRRHRLGDDPPESTISTDPNGLDAVSEPVLATGPNGRSMTTLGATTTVAVNATETTTSWRATT